MYEWNAKVLGLFRILKEFWFFRIFLGILGGVITLYRMSISRNFACIIF